MCEHGDRRVTRMENNGTKTPLATHFNVSDVFVYACRVCTGIGLIKPHPRRVSCVVLRALCDNQPRYATSPASLVFVVACGHFSAFIQRHASVVARLLTFVWRVGRFWRLEDGSAVRSASKSNFQGLVR